jgi:hypothetical protein
MQACVRFVLVVFPLATAAATASGCKPPSACGPVGHVSGQITLAEGSAGYQRQSAGQEAGSPETPYFACRSEAFIQAKISLATDSAMDPYQARVADGPGMDYGHKDRQNATTDKSGGGYSPATDPRLHAGSETTGRRDEQGQFRVLGVGRGVDRDDCGKTAMHACESAVDQYFSMNRAVRPLDVVCRLDENPEYCAASIK